MADKNRFASETLVGEVLVQISDEMTAPVGSDAHIGLNKNRNFAVIGVVPADSNQYYYEPFLGGNGYWYATVYNTDSSTPTNKVTSGLVKIKVIFISLSN